MKGFLLGLLVAALAFAGYVFWKSHLAGQATRGGTARADAGAAVGKKKRKRRGAVRLARAQAETSPLAASGRRPAGSRLASAPRPPPQLPPEPEPEPEPEPIRLSASDLKLVTQGDDLSRPDVLHLDMNEPDAPELGQDEIDARFRAQEDAIQECISKARPDPETYVPGVITIKFRIQRAGTVRGVRVQAPAILQKGGLYSCIKGIVGRLRFPASGGSQIVEYPFRLS
jgi:hypothetical protein